MTVNNLPKFLILLVGLLCLTALMIADKIDMASGVPIGWDVENGICILPPPPPPDPIN